MSTYKQREAWCKLCQKSSPPENLSKLWARIYYSTAVELPVWFKVLQSSVNLVKVDLGFDEYGDAMNVYQDLTRATKLRSVYYY